MNEQNAKQEPWSDTLPNDQGYYWRWNGDEDCAPVVLFVMFSGTGNKYFVSHNMISGAPWVQDVGGFWMPITPPSITPASTPADAPTGCPACNFTGRLPNAPELPCMCMHDPLNMDAPTTDSVATGSKSVDATGEAGEGPTPLTDQNEHQSGEDPFSGWVYSDFARKLERTIATLRAECEGLREDKVRLDYLEAAQKRGSVLLMNDDDRPNGRGLEIWWPQPNGKPEGITKGSLRKAIDAASRGTEGQG